MKITGSSLSMTSTHAATVRREHKETLRAWVGARPDFEGREARARAATTPGSRAAASGATSELVQTARDTRARRTDDARDAALEGATDEERLRIALIEALLSRALGRPVKLRIARVELDQPEAPELPVPASAPATPAGWGLEYDAHTSIDDAERTTVSIGGEIVTADGARIRVSLDAEMTRQFHSEENVSVRAGDGVRKDPLVLHFDGPASQLGTGRFAFDLDADAADDLVPTLGSGSGILVLDADGNGRATNGRELFGPTTGDGFAELARHDQDGNGWIDAGDTVFERLRIWRPDESGGGRFESLAELGVGAIGLGRVASPFDFRDDDNRTTGAITNTGMFLQTDGAAGLVQQIDFVV